MSAMSSRGFRYRRISPLPAATWMIRLTRPIPLIAAYAHHVTPSAVSALTDTAAAPGSPGMENRYSIPRNGNVSL